MEEILDNLYQSILNGKFEIISISKKEIVILNETKKIIIYYGNKLFGSDDFYGICINLYTKQKEKKRYKWAALKCFSQEERDRMLQKIKIACVEKF